ncbi:beta/gamma crystallin domain-containing protein 2 [Alligator mississippiensis]|uniref:beta/gamma crystallin domain-containing protein 2 n=1 Tax=Alligator mississippiensis TaxID=8496 RepID=UPI002877A289|nr:beta/gamma crystallin domain-containing protein 2 [Alligator mississippiensis]
MSLRARALPRDARPAKRGGIWRRLSWLFSRSESSLKDLQGQEDSTDGPVCAGTCQDGREKDRRKQKGSKESRALARTDKQDKRVAGGRRSLEPPVPGRPPKKSSKAHALSYSESDLRRNGLRRRFGSLPWGRRRSSQLELSGPRAGGQAWPFGRLARPAVGSDVDMAGRLELCSRGREQEAAARPVDAGVSELARHSPVDFFSSWDFLLFDDEDSSGADSDFNSSISLASSARPEMLPVVQEQPSHPSASVEEQAESIFQGRAGMGAETHALPGPAGDQTEHPAEPTGATLEAETCPAKEPPQICYKILITLAEAGGTSRAEHPPGRCEDGRGSPEAPEAAGDVGAPPGTAVSSPTDEQQCPGEPARPAPRLSACEEFQNCGLPGVGTPRATGQVRPVTGCPVTPLQGSQHGHREDQRDQSRPCLRDVPAAGRRAGLAAGSPAGSSRRPCRSGEGEKTRTDRPREASAGLDPSQHCTDKVAGGFPAPHAKADPGVVSATFSWKKALPDQPTPQAAPRFHKIALASRSMEGVARPRARGESPSRVSQLLAAWEKGLAGQKSADSPAPARVDRRKPPTIARPPDSAAHGPVFSQIYSPVQKQKRPAADSPAVPRFQRDGDVPGTHAVIVPLGSPRETPLQGPVSPASPLEAPQDAPVPAAVPGSQSQRQVLSTAFQSERRIALPKARMVTVLRSGRRGVMPGLGSPQVSEPQQGRPHVPGPATSISLTGPQREGQWPCANGLGDARPSWEGLVTVATDAVAGLQRDNGVMRPGSAHVRETWTDGVVHGGITGAETGSDSISSRVETGSDSSNGNDSIFTLVEKGNDSSDSTSTRVEKSSDRVSTRVEKDSDGSNSIFTQVEMGNDSSDSTSTRVEKSSDRVSTRVEKGDDGSDSISTRVEMGSNGIFTRVEKDSDSSDSISTQVEKSRDSSDSIFTQVEKGSDGSDRVSTWVEKGSDSISTKVEKGNDSSDSIFTCVEKGSNSSDSIFTCVEKGSDGSNRVSTRVEKGSNSIFTWVEKGSESSDSIFTCVEKGSDGNDRVSTRVEKGSDSSDSIFTCVEKGSDGSDRVSTRVEKGSNSIFTRVEKGSDSVLDPAGSGSMGLAEGCRAPDAEGAPLTAPQRAAGSVESQAPALFAGTEGCLRAQEPASHTEATEQGERLEEGRRGMTPSPGAFCPSQATESPSEVADEDPELAVDMELFVDTLRNMEPSEIRKPLKVHKQPRRSSLGMNRALPPIHEDHITPRSQVPFPEALNKLWAMTEGDGRKEKGPAGGRMEEEEEEEEIQNPYLSEDEKPPVQEEPRKVYSWEDQSSETAEDYLSLLAKLKQPPGDEKAKVSVPRITMDQSILFRANVLKGMALVSDFLEHKAAPTDNKPYSRLDNSVLYSRYRASAASASKELEKQQESRNPPSPVDLALLQATEQNQPPPNGPKSGERLPSEPSPEVLEVGSPGAEKAPGSEQSPDQTPPASREVEPESTPLRHPEHPEMQQKKMRPSKKINVRPGKIILYSEPGFTGQKRELWGDVQDATSWELSPTISVRVIRGGWVMYEKPQFHGRKCVLAEGDVEISNPWAAYQRAGEAPENVPFRIGSFKRVVQDYRTPEINLFSKENGEGAKARFMDSSEDTRTQGKALTAASIIVHSGLWLIYSKPFFDDDPYVLEPGGYPSLKAWGARDPSICSMHPLKLGCPVVEKPGEPKAVVYEKAHFQGHSCQVSRDVYDLKKQEGGQGPGMATVGSLRILGGCWVGYGKAGFRGHQYLLEEGEYPDWTQWGGYSKELVSLRVIRTDFLDPALVLFEAMDFEDGPSVELSEALPDVSLARYGSKTQSINVLSGVWVAYEGTNFSGEQYVLEKGVYRSCEDWGASNCQIGSVQPVLQVGEHSLHFVSRIQLFSHPDFLGHHISFEDDQGALPESFAPQSCRVHGGSWILYDGQDFEGEQHVLSEGEYPSLSAMGCISAAAVQSLKKVPLVFSEPSIFLHGLECFEGKEIELNSEVRSLQAEGFNNHVLSVRIKGGIWVLCEHSDFRGRQWLLDVTEITNWLTYSGLQHVGSLYPIRQRRIYFRLKNEGLELFLSVPDDVEDMKAGRVVTSALGEQSSTVWYYEEGLLKNQVAPTMSLQVIGPVGKGAKVVLWSETRIPRQTWRIDDSGRIWSQMFEDRILDVKGGQSYDRDHAVLWDVAEERPTQRWDLQVL